MSEEQKFYQKFTQKKASKKEKQSFSKKEKSIKQHSSQICQSGNKTKTTQSKQHTFQENQSNTKKYPKKENYQIAIWEYMDKYPNYPQKNT